MTHFALALRAARVAAGLSQNELFHRLRGKRERDFTIRRYEAGRRNATPESASRIALALGLPRWHFLRAVVLDMQDSSCTRETTTAVIVGVQTYAASTSLADWIALREAAVRAQGSGAAGG
jgi:ribosome-binding protein aMBF1 (putative translation factor)